MLLEVDTVYNFLTRSKTVLDPVYKNMRVTGYMKLKQAVRYTGVFTDVVTIREQLISETNENFLPSDEVRYILLEDVSGNEVLLAEDWIKPDSIEVVSSVKLKLIIDNITNSDISVIINVLKGMGYTTLDSEII